MATSERMGDGGPAFPVVAEIPPYHIAEGMTLRDYMAAKAMQAIAGMPGYSPCAIAVGAYEMADAMLAARSQP